MILGSGRSLGGGNGNPLQYFCLGNPMDRGAWKATVHKAAKSQARLNTHAQISKSKLDKILKLLSHAIKVNYTKKKKRETEDPKCGHPALHGAARVAAVDLTRPGAQKGAPTCGRHTVEKKGGRDGLRSHGSVLTTIFFFFK